MYQSTYYDIGWDLFEWGGSRHKKRGAQISLKKQKRGIQSIESKKVGVGRGKKEEGTAVYPKGSICTVKRGGLHSGKGTEGERSRRINKKLQNQNEGETLAYCSHRPELIG